MVTIVHKPTGAVVPGELIQSCTMSESFNSMLVTARVQIGDVNSTILSYLNIGEEFIFTFDDSHVKTNMSVLKFNKSANASSENSISYVVVDLVSSWYFNTFKLQPAYTATPSTIVRRILKIDNDLIGYQIDIESSDTRVFTHYRLSDNAFAFLKRVEAYSLDNSTPMYLYSETGNKINFKSFNSFYYSAPKYTIASPEILTGPKVLNPAYSYICSDASKASSVMSIKFNYENFMNPEVAGSLAIGNAEIGADLSTARTPETPVFFDWSVAPANAYALAIRAAFQKNIDVLYASCTFYGTVPQLEIGDNVEFLLKGGDGGTVSEPKDAFHRLSSTLKNTEDTSSYIVVGKTYTQAAAQAPVTIVTLVDANIGKN